MGKYAVRDARRDAYKKTLKKTLSNGHDTSTSPGHQGSSRCQILTGGSYETTGLGCLSEPRSFCLRLDGGSAS